MKIEKAENAIREALKEFGVTNKEVLENTPKRWLNFVKMYTAGLNKEYKDFKVFDCNNYNQMVVVDTTFTSLCEHHLLPFFGRVFVAYLPTTHVVGVSKIIKLVQHLSKKPTLQERLTEEITKTLKKNIPGTIGVATVVYGMHTCISTRYGNGWMTTASLAGVFKHNPYSKQEFLDYIKDKIDKKVFA